MDNSGFARCHPLVNFLFFLGAICFGVVFQHPTYLLAGILCAAIYYFLLQGKKALRSIARLLPLLLAVALINPLFNLQGERVLFRIFGRPYTLEALGYGFAVGGILVLTLLWFGCYNHIMTEDKFTALFGNLAPSLSLLLIMVFRLIPNLLGKAKQISDSRRTIGKGAEGASFKEKLSHGMTVLLSLISWALEDSLSTADSMRSRGYGTAKRTSFHLYRMRSSDLLLLLLTIVTAGLTLLGAITGATAATYTPEFSVAPINLFLPIYCCFLLIPTFLHGKEALLCHIYISKI